MHPDGRSVVVVGAGDEVGLELGNGEIVGGQGCACNGLGHDLCLEAGVGDEPGTDVEVLRLDKAAGCKRAAQRRAIGDEVDLWAKEADEVRVQTVRHDRLQRAGGGVTDDQRHRLVIPVDVGLEDGSEGHFPGRIVARPDGVTSLQVFDPLAAFRTQNAGFAIEGMRAIFDHRASTTQ